MRLLPLLTLLTVKLRLQRVAAKVVAEVVVAVVAVAVAVVAVVQVFILAFSGSEAVQRDRDVEVRVSRRVFVNQLNQARNLSLYTRKGR